MLQIATSFLLLTDSNRFVATATATRADVPQAIREQLIVSFDAGMAGEGQVEAARFAGDLESRLTARGDVSAVSFENEAGGRFTSSPAVSGSWRFTGIREVSPSY